ncbi:FAD-dependent monooxygenase [Nocardioides mangrovicus]|uniref:FAD-dependent monooxygenase n=1 Tax=Nocardioides mangrovicus TaxID=2478913 RepID=A0A3L8P6F9_9ACTN|nr:NAD(P)/FAD-dependent oxidoreductase [Nocardioides mangrovicus]RLV50674.1 FAD-dependent monooxygenase [Nocardioides mangrovicus]
MRVAVVGLGSAGPALALLLADAGHEVEVLEREPDPGPVGAGIWLQHLGQEVLDRLGLLDGLRAVSRPVDRVEGVTVSGRTVMDFGYADLPGATPALGVNRGALFSLLHRALLGSAARVRTGVTVTGVRPAAGGAVVETGAGDLGPYDLVVGADGSRSVVRAALGVTRRDRAYGYGALWAVVEDPEGVAGSVLHQCFDGTRRYFGVLPTGIGQASVFWSVPTAAATARDPAGWRAEAARFAGRYSPLLANVETLLPATYRDVAVSTPYRLAAGAAAVLVGDAAHAMSPQLGAGTSLALADAWVLAEELTGDQPLASALAAYARRRAAHWRWYRLWTRAMVPAFQSDLDALAAPRDLLAGPVGRVPWIRAQAVATLVGDRTSPWTRVGL